MCGRDPSETRLRVNPHVRLLRERERLWRTIGKGWKAPDRALVIGIPQALSTYSYLPLWRRFFNHLGYKIQLSGTSTPEIKGLAGRVCSGEFCFPVKVAHGHIASLSMRDGVDFLFVPQMVNEHSNPYTTNTTFCPYIQGVPTCAKAALRLNRMDTARLLVPVVDMKLSETDLAGKLAEELAGPLNCSRKKILRAWRSGKAAQRQFETACLEAGKKALADAKENNERLVVLVGRPYNIFDTGVNLSLPHKIAEYGLTVLPLDFLDIDLSLLSGRYENTYWNYGQKILAALRMVARSDNLEAIYLTNFGCGPDSFMMSFASEIMGPRPFLSLQLDEHNADTGYVTRIEAFYDVLNKSLPSACQGHALHKPSKQADNFKQRRIWIPSIHPCCSKLFAASFRRHGYDAQTLPAEDRGAFESGLKVTNGLNACPRH